MGVNDIRSTTREDRRYEGHRFACPVVLASLALSCPVVDANVTSFRVIL